MRCGAMLDRLSRLIVGRRAFFPHHRLTADRIEDDQIGKGPADIDAERQRRARGRNMRRW
jgi:hypothetical protein